MAALYVCGARVLVYNETLTTVQRRSLEVNGHLYAQRSGQQVYEPLEGGWDYRAAQTGLVDSDLATTTYALTHQEPNARPGVTFDPFVVDLQTDTFQFNFVAATDLAADLNMTLELLVGVVPNSAVNSSEESDESSGCDVVTNPFAASPSVVQDWQVSSPFVTPIRW
jgi:hypothetical protein